MQGVVISLRASLLCTPEYDKPTAVMPFVAASPSKVAPNALTPKADAGRGPNQGTAQEAEQKANLRLESQYTKLREEEEVLQRQEDFKMLHMKNERERRSTETEAPLELKHSTFEVHCIGMKIDELEKQGGETQVILKEKKRFIVAVGELRRLREAAASESRAAADKMKGAQNKSASATASASRRSDTSAATKETQDAKVAESSAATLLEQRLQSMEQESQGKGDRRKSSTTLRGGRERSSLTRGSLTRGSLSRASLSRGSLSDGNAANSDAKRNSIAKRSSMSSSKSDDKGASSKASSSSAVDKDAAEPTARRSSIFGALLGGVKSDGSASSSAVDKDAAEPTARRSSIFGALLGGVKSDDAKAAATKEPKGKVTAGLQPDKVKEDPGTQESSRRSAARRPSIVEGLANLIGAGKSDGQRAAGSKKAAGPAAAEPRLLTQSSSDSTGVPSTERSADDKNKPLVSKRRTSITKMLGSRIGGKVEEPRSDR
jgi:hypothetical protein